MEVYDKITTIRIKISTKEELDKLKIADRETYNEVIDRIIKKIKEDKYGN